jgi:hypothetical protein
LNSIIRKVDPRGENIVANLSLYNPITASSPIPASIDVALEKPILRRCKTFVVRLVAGASRNIFEISNTVAPSDIFATITDFVKYINFMLVRVWAGYINRSGTNLTISLAPYFMLMINYIIIFKVYQL